MRELADYVCFESMRKIKKEKGEGFGGGREVEFVKRELSHVYLQRCSKNFTGLKY